MTRKVYLTPTEPDPSDVTLSLETQSAMLNGTEPEYNLACGECKAVVAKACSQTGLRQLLGFDVPNRLIIECRCGATNLVQG